MTFVTSSGHFPPQKLQSTLNIHHPTLSREALSPAPNLGPPAPTPNTLAQCLSHCPPDSLSVLDELWLQPNNIWLLEICNYSLINFLKSTYFAIELKRKRVPAFRVVSSCGDNKKQEQKTVTGNGGSYASGLFAERHPLKAHCHPEK